MMGFLKKLFGLGVKKTKGPMDKSVALENLAQARDITEALGMRCWLTDGTLLGCYRENNFLGHDGDVDMGCLIDDYTPDIFDSFKKRGWACKSVFGRRDCGLEISFEKGGVKLDIFFFYREGNRLWHGAWRKVDKHTKNLIKYHYDSFDLKRGDFLGESFYIPADTEKYVATKYGPGWRTPVKEWDWTFGPSNASATEINLPRPPKPYGAASVK